MSIASRVQNASKAVWKKLSAPLDWQKIAPALKLKQLATAVNWQKFAQRLGVIAALALLAFGFYLVSRINPAPLGRKPDGVAKQDDKGMPPPAPALKQDDKSKPPVAEDQTCRKALETCFRTVHNTARNIKLAGDAWALCQPGIKLPSMDQAQLDTLKSLGQDQAACKPDLKTCEAIRSAGITALAEVINKMHQACQ